jgi:hypothetical protein
VSAADAITAWFPPGSTLSRSVTASLVFALGAGTPAGVESLDDLAAAASLLLTAGADPAVVRLVREDGRISVSVAPVSAESFDAVRVIVERLAEAAFGGEEASLALHPDAAGA